MIGYSQTHVFPPKLIDFLNLATVAVSCFPERLEGEVLRCHEVARAVAALLECGLVDGKYGPVEHSWCGVYSVQHSESIILDPYVVGRLPQVQLVAPVPGIGFGHYVKGPMREDVRHEVVNQLTIIGMKGVFEKLGRRCYG